MHWYSFSIPSITMRTTSKPVIVIVHGAFHPPVYYRKFIEPLRASGYTVLAPAMPTTGLDDSVAGKTYRDDVRRIYESLLPLLDEGREAVIVGHSQVRMQPGEPTTELKAPLGTADAGRD